MAGRLEEALISRVDSRAGSKGRRKLLIYLSTLVNCDRTEDGTVTSGDAILGVYEAWI